jgi:hypothetical protein
VLRALALLLLVAAFARPFFLQGALAARGERRHREARGAARSVGEHGLRRSLGGRQRAAAHKAIDG